MPWDLFSKRSDTLSLSKVKSETGQLKRERSKRLPFTRQNVCIPALTGARRHRFFWNEDSLTMIRKIMSDDSSEDMSEAELRYWNDFVTYQDRSSHSPTVGQIGCTDKDNEGYSFVVKNMISNITEKEVISNKEVSTNITSPNYPLEYNNSSNEWYKISEEGMTSISLHFNGFTTEGGYDKLTIYDKEMLEIDSLTGDLGDFATREYGTSELNLNFTSDGSQTRTGWSIDKYTYSGVSKKIIGTVEHEGIDYTDMGTRPMRTEKDHIVSKSLDKILMGMVDGESRFIDSGIDIPLEELECPTDILLTLDEVGITKWEPIESYRELADEFPKSNKVNMTEHMVEVQGYEKLYIKCPVALVGRFNPCEYNVLNTRSQVLSAKDQNGTDQIASYDDSNVDSSMTQGFLGYNELELKKNTLVAYYSIETSTDTTKMMKQWLLVGWNVLFNAWEKIDRRVDEPEWIQDETRRYVCQFPDFYSKIRILSAKENKVIEAEAIVENNLPAMSENITSEATVSSSSDWNSGFYPYRALNHIEGDNDKWIPSTKNNGEWWQIELTNSISVEKIQLMATNDTYQPKTLDIRLTNESGLEETIRFTNDTRGELFDKKIYELGIERKSIKIIRLTFIEMFDGTRAGISELEALGTQSTLENYDVGKYFRLYQDVPLPEQTQLNTGIIDCSVTPELKSVKESLAEFFEGRWQDKLISLVPELTSDTSNGEVLEENRYNNDRYLAFHAFDNIGDSLTKGNDNDLPFGVGYVFDVEKKIENFTITQYKGYSSPTEWELFVSEDGETWTSYYRSEPAKYFEDGETRIYEVPKMETGYRYYKVLGDKHREGYQPELYTLKLMGRLYE